MNLNRILAAVDLTSRAPRAVLTAAELAALTKAELVVLTVLRDPWEQIHADEVEGLRRIHIGSPATLAASRASAQLKQLTGSAALAAPEASYRTAFGLPGVEIARQAEESQADLIVLGRSDRVLSGMGESVTAATLRRSRVPVLIAPLSHRVYRRVLACVDDSPGAPAVLAAALAMGDQLGARVLALHVAVSETTAAPGERLRRLRRLEGKEKQTGGVSVATCEMLERHGDPATQILAEAAARDVDLVVIGHCRGARLGPEDTSLGVTAQVVRRAEAAVLTVPI